MLDVLNYSGFGPDYVGCQNPRPGRLGLALIRRNIRVLVSLINEL
jgi:hypothetical protein